MAEKASSRPSDRWIPWAFVLFFAVIALLDGIFVTIAVTSHTGLATENAYEKGLTYNETLSAVAQQESLGWTAGISLEQQDGTTGLLRVDLLDKDGRPLTGALTLAELIRPTHAGYDFSQPLVEMSEGAYAADVSFPLPGQWDIRLRASLNGMEYQQTKRVVLR